MSRPFFTIGVYTFKNEQYLEQALKSVLNQTFSDFECLLIDDGSPGVPYSDYQNYQDKDYNHSINVKGVPQNTQAKYIFDQLVGNDPRFKYIRKQNEGLCEARNLVFRTAKGKWYVGLDGDDWVKKDHLEKFAEEINKPSNKFKIPFFSGTQFYNSNTYKPPIFYPAKVTLANLAFNHLIGQWNFVASVDIIQKYDVKSDPRIGPGPKKEIQIIKTGGFDDINYAWRYVEAVQKEYKKNNFVFVDTKQNTYMYRDLPTSATKQNTDVNVNFNNLYAIYLKPFCIANSDYTVKMVGVLYPIWTSLWFTKNLLLKIIKSCLTVILRLVTRCYF